MARESGARAETLLGRRMDEGEGVRLRRKWEASGRGYPGRKPTELVVLAGQWTMPPRSLPEGVRTPEDMTRGSELGVTPG